MLKRRIVIIENIIMILLIVFFEISLVEKKALQIIKGPSFLNHFNHSKF